jgi:2-polyprenyl-6-methoxyphenol hydroxylase-like FAD-dependent oxidoreductase
MAPVDVLVRGAGVVGLAGALALSRLGLNVALLDWQAAPGAAAPVSGATSVAAATAARASTAASATTGSPAAITAPAAVPDLRAYALNAASVALLQTLKVWDALPADARTPVYDMRIEGDQAGAVLEFSAWSQTVGELAFIVDAAALEATLRDAARFAPHLTRVQAPVPAALTVLAEGRDSATRQAYGAGWPVHAYGHSAIAARLVASLPHNGLARQWFRSPDVLALLPFDRPELGRSYGLVWSMPTPQAQALLALPDAQFEQALMAATGGAAGPTGLGGAIGALALSGPRASWPLASGHAERVFGPGWVLVGDAAHVVHPLAGQGLNLGLADVACLAQVLADRAAQEPWRELGDERLLARHARQRQAATRAMGLVTDGLLQLFSHPSPLARELRNRGLTLLNQLAPLKRALAAQALGR